MIRIENFVGPSNDQWAAVIRGMRNPMNSWHMRDSGVCRGKSNFDKAKEDGRCVGCPHFMTNNGEDPSCYAVIADEYRLGKKDLKLAKGLIAKGVADRKFLRQLPVIMDIIAPLYWWKQMDKYQIGTVTDSCSTMHKVTERKFNWLDFSFDARNEYRFSYGEERKSELPLFGVTNGDWNDPKVWKKPGTSKFDPYELEIFLLNTLRDKYLETGEKRWWKAIVELLPESYNQRRTWSANYEVLRTICRQREGHKLKEWADFIQWVRDNVPYAEELIF